MTGLFSLGMLSLVLVGGVIGDLLGRRRILLIGLGGLVAAKLSRLNFAATAPGLP